MSFMLHVYVTVIIRRIVNLLFLQRITMFTQIITMFNQHFMKCQFYLPSLPEFQKSWHKLNEPLIARPHASVFL